jgi:tetratricopeptide (TPR) repeat protein
MVRFCSPWLIAAWVLPNNPQVPPVTQTTIDPASAATRVMQSESRPETVTGMHSSAWLSSAAQSSSTSTPSLSFTTSSTTVLAAATSQPPSEEDVKLLQQAFGQFYGVERDLVLSDKLLTQTIDRWEVTKQPADELAGLYRVRGDCRMLSAQASDAQKDFNVAVTLLQKDPVALEAADPAELPAALLGRARAQKSQKMTSAQAVSAAADYEKALKLTSREEWDTEQELLEDGASRNPYAAWEWGSALRTSGDYGKAALAHSLAAVSFDATGDKGRAVVSQLDAGIDLASMVTDGKSKDEAVSVLQKAIQQTKGVEARDVTLLQRVIAKESEGRMALAALLWNDSSNSNNKQLAETNRGEACIRLEQLQADAASRKDTLRTDPIAPLPYSIDDDIAPLDMSCNKFKNTAFLNDLEWSESLQKKVIKLETLR